MACASSFQRYSLLHCYLPGASSTGAISHRRVLELRSRTLMQRLGNLPPKARSAALRFHPMASFMRIACQKLSSVPVCGWDKPMAPARLSFGVQGERFLESIFRLIAASSTSRLLAATEMEMAFL